MPYGRRKSSGSEFLHNAQQQAHDQREKQDNIEKKQHPFTMLKRFIGVPILLYTTRDLHTKKQIVITDTKTTFSADDGHKCYLRIEGQSEALPIDLPRDVREEGKKLVFDYSANFERPDQGKRMFELEIIFEFVNEEDYKHFQTHKTQIEQA